MINGPSFASLAYANKKKKTRREKFLEEKVRLLLSNDLDCVSVNPSPTDDDDQYLAWMRDGTRGCVSKESLAWLIFDNLDNFDSDYDEWERDWLLSHLEADIKAERPEVGDMHFRDLCTEYPYEVIDTLRILVSRGTYRGTCPVCEAWK